MFLIHGLGGTQYDLGSMHKRLKNAGFVTHSLTLPGHGTTPEDLVNVTAEDWIDAVVAKYREVRDAHPTLHLMGMCMGALLAAVLAAARAPRQGPARAAGAAGVHRRLGHAVVSRAAPAALRGARTAPAMKIEEEEPYGIKNEQLRAIVKAKFERGENFHYRWVPLECLRQVDRLRAVVMKAAPKIACPTLVVHAREDELTSLRSANFLVEKIGGGRARMVVLEDSYHMVCVDNDKEIVARNVLEFFGAAMPGATSILANEPRMSPDELAAAVAALTACLERGDFEGVRALGIPDLAWVQPGVNKVAGAHAGKSMGAFAGRMTHADAGAPRFTAFGTPVFNRGIALVPATLIARRDTRIARIAGRAAVRLARRQAARSALVRRRRRARGRVLRSARPRVERTVRARAVVRERPPPNRARSSRRPATTSCSALYSLYKQASAGDVSGERPGALDMVGPRQVRRVGEAQGRCRATTRCATTSRWSRR